MTAQWLIMVLLGIITRGTYHQGEEREAFLEGPFLEEGKEAHLEASYLEGTEGDLRSWVNNISTNRFGSIRAVPPKGGGGPPYGI